MNERMLTMLAQWALSANTNIPAPPVPGQAYRNAALDAVTINSGQRYSSVADSAEWNQLHYIMTGMIRLLEQFGMLPYSSLTDYPQYGKAMGLDDGAVYEAVQSSGPSYGGAQPITLSDGTVNADYWRAFSGGAGGGLDLPGVAVPYKGVMGGPDNKHPVHRITGEPNLNYALCDGGTYIAPSDGASITTPDMRDRFIIGAGSSYAIGATGGANSHLHEITVGYHTLTWNEMAVHGHSFWGHANITGLSGSINGWAQCLMDGATRSTDNAGAGAGHNHPASSNAVSNLPPFYAFAYIMQL